MNYTKYWIFLYKAIWPAQDPRQSSLNVSAAWGETPLMMAVSREQEEVVRLLATLQGVQLDTRDGQGRGLLQVAR